MLAECLTRSRYAAWRCSAVEPEQLLLISGCGDSTFNAGDALPVTAVAGTTVTYNQVRHDLMRPPPVYGDEFAYRSMSRCRLLISARLRAEEDRSQPSRPREAAWMGTCTTAGLRRRLYGRVHWLVSNDSGSTVRTHFSIGLWKRYGAALPSLHPSASVLGAGPPAVSALGGLLEF